MHELIDSIDFIFTIPMQLLNPLSSISCLLLFLCFPQRG